MLCGVCAIGVLNHPDILAIDDVGTVGITTIWPVRPR
jgi:hypothetical protein